MAEQAPDHTKAFRFLMMNEFITQITEHSTIFIINKSCN